MSKLIRHEFRATARLILPFYIVLLVSGLYISLVSEKSNLLEKLELLFGFLFIAALFGIGFMCLFILISRFYTNTMTDRAYLTMTLPLTVHEFIWGELIVSLLWFLISAAVIGGIALLCLSITGMLSLPDSIRAFRSMFREICRVFSQNGIRWSWIVLYALECIVGIITLLLNYCLRFYLAMACGQLFHRHRILFSVLSYLLIGALLSALFLLAVYLLSRCDIAVTAISAPAEVRLVLLIGLGIDLAVLAAGALLYVPTAALLKNKLNLN